MTTIHQLAERAAHAAALSMLAAEHTGAWAANTERAHMAEVYAAWSQHLGWHASLFTQRYPVIPGLDAAAAMAEAHLALRQHAEALAGAQTDTEFVASLVAHVWDPMMDDLQRWRAGTEVHLDRPTHRVLDLVLADLTADRAQALALSAAL